MFFFFLQIVKNNKLKIKLQIINIINNINSNDEFRWFMIILVLIGTYLVY